MTSVIHRLGIVPGVRVRIVQQIERFPHFQLAPGGEGTVSAADADRIAVTMDERIDGADAWNNTVEWALLNGGTDTLRDFLFCTQRADGAPWALPGDALADAHFRYALARRFAVLLRADVGADRMGAILARNAQESQSGICHSHDFCDANVTMAQAWADVAGIEMHPTNDAQLAAWNAAWTLAIAARFRAPALVPGARYRATWGDEFDSAGDRDVDGDFFDDANGYDSDDLASIGALDVGQCWLSSRFGTHRVKRIS